MKGLISYLVIALVSTILPLYAQGTGIIHGSVRDVSGLAVPNA